MTNRWKTSSSKILLVLILVKAEWTKGETDNSLDYANSIDKPKDENVSDQTSIYVGNDEIAQYFFSSSAKDNSSLLGGINKCLDNFHLLTCMKMLLLDRINDAVGLMEEPSVRDADVRFLNGLLVFKIKNETEDSSPSDMSDGLSLDEEITAKVRRIFWGRSLLVNVLPNIQIEIEPARGKPSEFICFRYTVRRELESTDDDEENENESRARKRKRKKGNKGGENGGGDNGADDGNGNENGNGNGNENGNGNRNGNRRGSRRGSGGKKRKGGKGGGMPMMMMVPQILMMGLMPFTLASLKAMVMNAVMVNMMALNGAIFMTIRNLVFGPRKGDNVMYVNYGYSQDKEPKTKRPVLIIHSPAAFVKQPPVPKKPFYGPYHGPQNHFQGNGGASPGYQNRNANSQWRPAVGHHFQGSVSGPSNFFHDENADSSSNEVIQNQMSANADSNLYQLGHGELLEAEVLDLGDEDTVDRYYVAPSGQYQNRRRWQDNRKTYRPNKVRHFLRIKPKN